MTRKKQFLALCGVVDRVGIDLAEADVLTDTQKLCEWVDTLQFAVKHIPEGYEKSRAHLLARCD